MIPRGDFMWANVDELRVETLLLPSSSSSLIYRISQPEVVVVAVFWLARLGQKSQASALAQCLV